MADFDVLSHAYLRAHPLEAARVLEAVPAEQVAALFARVPARIAAPVMAAMLPAAAVRGLALVEDERALELLAALGTLAAVALLRQMPKARRERLLGRMPASAALVSNLLLGYPENAVGAWCDPDVLSLPADARVAEALERLRQGDSAGGWIYLSGSAQRLLGQVPLAALLRAPASARLDSLARPCPAMLAASSPLGGASAHPGWKVASLLPVVEAGDRLIGVLAREALDSALAERAPAQAARDDGVASLFSRGYWQALSGIAEATLNALPGVPPLARGRDER